MKKYPYVIVMFLLAIIIGVQICEPDWEHYVNVSLLQVQTSESGKKAMLEVRLGADLPLDYKVSEVEVLFPSGVLVESKQQGVYSSRFTGVDYQESRVRYMDGFKVLFEVAPGFNGIHGGEREVFVLDWPNGVMKNEVGVVIRIGSHEVEKSLSLHHPELVRLYD